MIKTLTSWRGIFALCIVCFHFSMHEFDQMTYAGVTFFFILSGFLVGKRYSSIESCRSYYRHRFARLFPLHWFALAGMIVLDLLLIRQFRYGWDLPLHVALLQSWVPYQSVYYNYSIHSWFLSSMLFCVIATPPVLKLIKQISQKTAWIAIIIVCLVTSGATIVAGETLKSYYYVFPLFRLVDYTLGILLGRALRDCASIPLTITKSTAIELGTLAVFAVFIALHASGHSLALKLENATMWWIPMLLLIVCFTIVNGQEGLIGKLLTMRPFLWLGEISFEIYILQKLVNNAFCYLIAPFFGHFGILIYDYSFACTLPLLIVVAWLVHRFFTKPISMLIA